MSETIFFISYLIGFFILIGLGLRELNKRRVVEMARMSNDEFGLVILLLALLWPIIVPVVTINIMVEKLRR